MIELPDHLADREVSNQEYHIHIRERGGKPMCPAGTLSDWWPDLTDEQRNAVIMASIMDVGSENPVDLGGVYVHLSGEIVVTMAEFQQRKTLLAC